MGPEILILAILTLICIAGYFIIGAAIVAGIVWVCLYPSWENFGCLMGFVIPITYGIFCFYFHNRCAK